MPQDRIDWCYSTMPNFVTYVVEAFLEEGPNAT